MVRLPCHQCVGYEVWERASSCKLEARFASCYVSDPVLKAFLNLNVNGAWQEYFALNAFSAGSWSATPGGDGDSWTVSVIMADNEGNEYGPISWTVWESNGYIQAAQ
jgi:hypothetical protein